MSLPIDVCLTWHQWPEMDLLWWKSDQKTSMHYCQRLAPLSPPPWGLHYYLIWYIPLILSKETKCRLLPVRTGSRVSDCSQALTIISRTWNLGASSESLTSSYTGGWYHLRSSFHSKAQQYDMCPHASSSLINRRMLRKWARIYPLRSGTKGNERNERIKESWISEPRCSRCVWNSAMAFSFLSVHWLPAPLCERCAIFWYANRLSKKSSSWEETQLEDWASESEQAD